jgi:DNA-3-methyladenine glycosylase I
MKRCEWAKKDLAIKYHDEEWGVPLYDNQKLFEFLILEGFQAGLSWDTILAKRENYRTAFDNFDAKKIAKYNDRKFDELMQNAGIVRNRLKIKSAIQNANAFLKVVDEFGSFDKYIWSFVDGKPIKNKFKKIEDVPAKTEISDAMSKDLKKRGFNFVGSTICYAFMQATGMVNDHIVSCFRYEHV